MKKILQKFAIYVLKKTNYKFKIIHKDVNIILSCESPILGLHPDNVGYELYAENIEGAYLGNGRWKTQGESWKNGYNRVFNYIENSAKVQL